MCVAFVINVLRPFVLYVTTMTDVRRTSFVINVLRYVVCNVTILENGKKAVFVTNVHSYIGAYVTTSCRRVMAPVVLYVTKNRTGQTDDMTIYVTNSVAVRRQTARTRSGQCGSKMTTRCGNLVQTSCKQYREDKQCGQSRKDYAVV